MTTGAVCTEKKTALKKEPMHGVYGKIVFYYLNKEQSLLDCFSGPGLPLCSVPLVDFLQQPSRNPSTVKNGAVELK